MVYMMVNLEISFNDGSPMNDDAKNAPDGASERKLSPAAERALAEAAARQQAYHDAEAKQPKELGGRGGKEPARYGDWEVKGIATDF